LRGGSWVKEGGWIENIERTKKEGRRERDASDLE